MKICMVLYEPQGFGGLEELTATLALGLHQLGHQVSVLSTTWVPPDNQYLRRLRDGNVTYVQLPKWLSRPASDWPTKEKILATVIWLASPIIILDHLGDTPDCRSNDWAAISHGFDHSQRLSLQYGRHHKDVSMGHDEIKFLPFNKNPRKYAVAIQAQMTGLGYEFLP